MVVVFLLLLLLKAFSWEFKSTEFASVSTCWASAHLPEQVCASNALSWRSLGSTVGQDTHILVHMFISASILWNNKYVLQVKLSLQCPPNRYCVSMCTLAWIHVYNSIYPQIHYHTQTEDGHTHSCAFTTMYQCTGQQTNYSDIYICIWALCLKIF